jgi:hypothetical protein
MSVCYDLMNNGTLVSKKLGKKRLIYVRSIHDAGEFAPPKATPIPARPHGRRWPSTAS